MPVNVNQQTVVFFACILTGLLSGIFCDAISIIATKLRFKKGAVFVKDILFWILTLAFFFTVIYRINGAELRWYVFLGGGFGGLVYILLLRCAAVKIISRVLGILGAIIAKILKILTYPVRLLMKLLRPLDKYVQSAQKKSRNFVQKNIEKLRRIKVLLNKV